MRTKLVHVYDETQLRIVYTGRSVPLADDIEAKINDHWNAVLESGKDLFRGEVYCVYRIDQRDGVRITLARTDYAHYMATFDGILAKPYQCRILYCSVILVSSDGHIVLGQMADRTSAPGQVQCIGGSLSSEFVSEDGSCDMRSCAYQELEEEIYLSAKDPEHITSFDMYCLKTGGDFGSVGVMYLAHTSYTKNKLEKVFQIGSKCEKKEGKLPEFEQLVFAPADQESVNRFLKDDARPCCDYVPPLLQMLVS